MRGKHDFCLLAIKVQCATNILGPGKRVADLGATQRIYIMDTFRSRSLPSTGLSFPEYRYSSRPWRFRSRSILENHLNAIDNDFLNVILHHSRRRQ